MMAACRNAGAQVPGREDRVKWKTRRARSHPAEDALDPIFPKKTEGSHLRARGICSAALGPRSDEPIFAITLTTLLKTRFFRTICGRLADKARAAWNRDRRGRKAERITSADTTADLGCGGEVRHVCSICGDLSSLFQPRGHKKSPRPLLATGSASGHRGVLTAQR